MVEKSYELCGFDVEGFPHGVSPSVVATSDISSVADETSAYFRKPGFKGFPYFYYISNIFFLTVQSFKITMKFEVYLNLIIKK